MQLIADMEASEVALPTRDSGPARSTAVLVLVGLTVVFLVSIFLKAQEGDYFTICAFKNLTGLPCPGCGLTHSFCAFAKGHFMQALSFNMLGPPLFLTFMLIWVRSALVLVGWTKPALTLDRVMNRPRIVRAFLIALLLFGFARILYVVIYHPEALSGAPLLKLVRQIIG